MWTQSRKSVGRIVVATAFGVLASCGGEGPTGEELGAMQQEIRGNYRVDNTSRAEDLTEPEGVVGAVVRLAYITPDGSEVDWCSGTLVSRRHVLTAGHCNVPNAVSYKVRFAQDRNHPFSASMLHVWDTKGPGDGGGGKDVALLLLDQPVPPSLVHNIPRVNTGDVGNFIRRNRNQPYIIAGYGEHPSERRFGPVKTPEAMILECSWFGSIVEFTCLPYPELWLDFYGDYAKGESGDSGGPLFGKDADTGEFVLIGVRSGHRWWKSDLTFDPNKQVYSPIGKLGKGGVQVASYLEDGDRDGIPDYMDNCPASFCEEHNLPMSHCINWAQEDDDGDGIGEACDNCPQWRCTSIGDGRTCQNVEQKDRDRDGVGDVCDPCPDVYSWDDAYPEGPVGLHCGCGDDTQFPGCDTDADCALAYAGWCVRDKDVAGNVVGKFCGRLPDVDMDGVPDACDTCKDVADVDDENSNVHIEKELRAKGVGVLHRGNVCDPVPIVPIEKGRSPTYPWYYVPVYGNGDEGVDYQELKVYPWMGEEPSLAPRTFKQPVVFRHCSCYDPISGYPVGKDECAERICPPSEAEDLDGEWKLATVGRQLPGGVIEPLPGGLELEFTHYERPADHRDKSVNKPPKQTIHWLTYQDISRPNDPIILHGGVIRGLMASVVLKQNDHFGSLRDKDYKLRTVVELIHAPRFQSGPPPVAKAEPCFMRGCGWILRPWEVVVNPNPVERVFESTFDWIRYSELGFGLLQPNGGFSDVAHILSQDLRGLLATGEWAWIPASESAVVLAQKEVDRVGILVPRAGTLGMTPLAIVVRDGVITFDGIIESASSEDELGGAVQISDAERAVYSAVQNRLYIAGFEHGWRAITLNSDTVETGVFERSPVEDLHGLTYDAIGGRMFSLEVFAVAENQKVASIYMYDMSSGDAKEVWSVPYTAAFEHLALAADKTGSVVLMASGPGGFKAWRYLYNGVDELIFKGSTAVNDAKMLGEPLHSELKVPLLKDDGTAAVFQLDVSKMIAGDACTSL